jgi:hypothetical protein
MKTKSVTSYANANIEALAEVSSNPRDIVAEMEEAFMRNFLAPTPHVSLMPKRALTDVIANDPVMGSMAEQLAAFRERRFLAKAKWAQRYSLYSAFGRYGLEKDEKAIVAKAKEGLESVEDRLAAVCYAIQKIRSRKEWKAEQNKPQEPSACLDMCLTYDLPPRTKGKSHQPAYYSITGPKGHTIDLSKQDRQWKPKLCKNPNEAFRAFLTRLGVYVNGGEVQLLNMLLKEPMVEITNDNGEVEKCYKWLPSYVTTNCGAWFVTVGWRLNPKCAPSRYWVDADGELTQEDPNKGLPPDHEAYQPPLTLSQLDYHLLSDSSDLAVANEDEEIVEYMNEEEEFLTFCPQRENEPDFIDFSQFCEDDEEMELLNAAANVIERSEGGLTIGDLQSKAFTDDYLHDGIESAKETIKRCMMQPDPTPLTEQIIEWMQAKITRLVRLSDLHTQFVETKYNEPSTPRACFTAHADCREPSRIQDCMLVMPSNEIEQPVIRELSRLPASNPFTMSLDDARKLRRRKYVCQSINKGRFGMLIREKAAADTFAAALEGALRA